MRAALLHKRQPGRRSSEVNAASTSIDTRAHAGSSAGMPLFLQSRKGSAYREQNPASAGYEDEADRAAASIQSDSGTVAPRPALRAGSGASTLPQSAFEASGVRSGIDATRGGGNRLPAAIRARMEDRLGANFSQVRIHNDSQAHGLSSAMGANAFTTGNDVYFNRDRYHPESSAGQGLLAHELTHVVQQGGDNAGTIQCSMMESLAPTALGGFQIGMATRNATPPGTTAGMEGTIAFYPDPNGPYSTEITLIQTANMVDMSGNTTPIPGSPVDWRHTAGGTEAARNEVRTPLGGTFLDAIYADAPRSSAVTPSYVQPADAAARPTQNYHGWLRSPADVHDASLYDFPSSSADRNFTFETVAKGSDNQVVYGSLEWGFQTRSGVVQNEFRHPHALESAEFDEALERFRGYYTHEPVVLYFDTDRDTPMTGELTKLSDVTSYMTKYPDVTLQVDGYADETGPSAYNSQLSLRRADNVVAILTGMGVDSSRIESLTIGHGETTAFAPGSPPAAAGSLRANRRVIITFVRNATTPIAP